MKTRAFLFLAVIALMASSCSEDPNDDPNNPTVSVFTGLVFNDEDAFFNTDGSMTTPVDSTQAKTMSSSIDFTFIYNFDYSEPGFMDPVTRSAEWYWDDYRSTWLSNAVATKFYSTTLTKSDFDAAISDPGLVDTYFLDTNDVKLAPHGIFPTGTCIGGRQSSNPVSIVLAKNKVYGFKNVSSGKKGLIFVRNDQAQGWPNAFINSNTKIDLIKQD